MEVAVIDAFPAFHHGKESPVVAILAMYDTFDWDVKRATQEFFVVHWLSMCGWFHTFFSKKVGPSIRYKVTARASKKETRIGTNSWRAGRGVC